MNDKELIVFAFITASTYRVKTIKAVGSDIINPTEIVKRTNGIRTNHISKVLKDLKEKKVVICINEDAKKNRLYKLTPLGVKMLEAL